MPEGAKYQVSLVRLADSLLPSSDSSEWSVHMTPVTRLACMCLVFLRVFLVWMF